MKVIVTGSGGLVGRALVRSLLADGHSVTRLVRGGAQQFSAPGTAAVAWDPDGGTIDAGALEGHDAAVHLAGEPVAEGRWDDAKKRRILESRVKGTRLLAETLAGLKEKPRVLVSASAVGFYGDRGAEVMREESASGEGFLSEVCREWEKATLAASQAGGGRLRGPVNAVAPGAVTNEEFTKALGGVLGRPTFLPVPVFALRLAFGEVADAVMLASTRVEPARLKEAGLGFQHTDIEGALRSVLK